MEQLVCSLPREAGGGPAILARSAGLTREVAAEAMTALTAWGPPLEGGAARPAIASLPLQGSLPGTPGRIHLAARAQADAESAVIVHALLLGQSDYAAFGYNPFRLQAEGLFLDAWAPGLILERTERRPNSFAAFVSPLPDEHDAELLSEALRAYFTAGRLVVPLARPEEAAERFFALFLETVPAYMRRELAFASFAPGGASWQSAGAARAPEGSFASWSSPPRFAPRRSLPPELEEYVATVRQHVAAGDLMALAAFGRALDHAPSRRSATDSGPAAQAPACPPACEAPPGRGRGAGTQPDVRTATIARDANPVRIRRRASPVDERRARNRAGRGAWLVLLAVLALGVGATVVLSRRPPPGNAGAQASAAGRAVAEAGAVAPAEPTRVVVPRRVGPRATSGLDGVIDIAALYDAELDAFLSRTAVSGERDARRKAGQRARAALVQRGGLDLRRQAQEFLASSALDVDPAASPAREAQRSVRRQEQAHELARELRRLALASYALDRGEPWADLGGLEADALAARWDSLRRHDPRGLAAAEVPLEIEGLAKRIDAARRQAASAGRLAALLGQERRDTAWLPQLSRLAAELAETTLPPGLTAWRDASAALAALKAAEDSTGFAALALDPAWERDPVPAAAREALDALRRTLDAVGAGDEPRLAVATRDLHDGLARSRALLAAGASGDQLAQLLADLAGNAALAFDPGAYADHFDRARLQALSADLARGRAPAAVPLALFPRENRQASLAFLRLEREWPSGAAWQEFAASTPVPFLARLAVARAHMAGPAPAREDSPFERDFRRLAAAAGRLALEAQRGRDWTRDLVELRGRIDTFRATYPDRPSLPSAQREKTARLAACAAALDAPLGVPLSRVSVALDARQLRDPAEVVVVLIAAGGEAGYRTPAILMGREAAAGWTGSRDLEGEISLRPARPLEVRITRVADGRTLAVARYGGDAAGAVPGALLRPAPAAPPEGGDPVGSVSFSVPGWFWRRLAVPEPRGPLGAGGSDGDGSGAAR